MQKTRSPDYYRFGRINAQDCPCPAGDEGIDSDTDWFQVVDDWTCRTPSVPIPTISLDVVDDVVAFPGDLAFRPLLGFYMPIVARVSLFVTRAFGTTGVVAAATPLVFVVQLRLGVPITPEIVGAVKVTLPTINDGGLVFRVKGEQVVAGELWGYVPAAAGAVPLRFNFRMLADNVGECCEVDFEPGPMGSLFPPPGP